MEVSKKDLSEDCDEIDGDPIREGIAFSRKSGNHSECAQANLYEKNEKVATLSPSPSQIGRETADDL
jgi:hypothetical protein